MFKKYSSIENTYRSEFLDRIKGHGFWEEDYVVQEKVHGANLSFWTKNGKNFIAAKRTGPIEEGERFNNYEQLLEKLKPGLINIWEALKQERPQLEQMTVFGEVIGGDYPHPKIEKNKAAILVQRGVFYSPDNHFYAFDILINTEEYLSIEQANTYFEREGFLHAQTLFTGKIGECLSYPNDFDTKIPQKLGLPVLSPNLCEGVVIRPVHPRYFNNKTRVILKNKNERWSENKKYHRSIKQEEALSEKITQLQEAILLYVTENRLNNVLSKIGEFSSKDFGRVLGMFNKDVVEDFLKDYGHITADLERKELRLVTKSFSKEAIALINGKLSGSSK